MSTSAAQAIPSLISLIKHADTVLHNDLKPNMQLLHLTTYFDEAVHVKVNYCALCTGLHALINVE